MEEEVDALIPVSRRNLLHGMLVGGLGWAGAESMNKIAFGKSIRHKQMQSKDLNMQTEYFMSDKQKSYAYAQGKRAGNIIYLAGTPSMDKDCRTVAIGNMGEQIRTIYQTLEESLAAFGAEKKHIVRETLFIADMDAFLKCLPIREKFYGDLYVASSWIGVTKLGDPDYLLEIEITADLSKR